MVFGVVLNVLYDDFTSFAAKNFDSNDEEPKALATVPIKKGGP